MLKCFIRMKKIIKFNKPYVSLHTKKNLLSVLSNRVFADGIFQKKTEILIQRLIKSHSIKLTQSCTSALEVAMILANIGKGDEVIMPSYTFPSTANCVILRKAKPVFADINKFDLNLDVKSVEKKINKRTKAIIVVHYGGIPCDMNKFMEIAKKYKLLVIEDAAHAFLSKFKKKFIGTIGDLGAFSFHETKNIVGGQCGALSINNKRFIKRANIILDKGTNRFSMGKKNYYSWKDIGSEYRAPELSSALTYSQLLKIKIIQKKRGKLWNNYFNALKEFKNELYYIPFLKDKNKLSSYHTFTVIFKKKQIRDNFIKFMYSKNIQCYFHYFPLHKSTYGKKFCNYKLKYTDDVYNGLVRLPLYPDLSITEQQKIIKKFIFFVKNYPFYKI